MRFATAILVFLGTAVLALALPPSAFAVETTAAKDFWDKLSALSGLLVATIGAIATYVYNRRQRASQATEAAHQLRVTEVQTVANFLPHLQSDDAREKEAALVAMSALGNTQLVTRLADIYRDPASLGALSRIASGLEMSAVTPM